MPEEEPAQILELSDGEVRKGARLSPLFSRDSDANVRSLNHIDVVGTIANRQSRLPLTVLLDEADETCLL